MQLRSEAEHEREARLITLAHAPPSRTPPSRTLLVRRRGNAIARARGAVHAQMCMSINKCEEQISDNVMLEDDQVKSVEGDGFYSWFVVTVMMPRTNTAMPHPNVADPLHTSVKGKIFALHNPHGGLVL